MTRKGDETTDKDADQGRMHRTRDMGTESPHRSLTRSRPVRVVFAQDHDQQITYEVSITGPFLPLTGRREDFIARAENDGLPYCAIASALTEWAQSRADVEVLTLGHSGSRYEIGILLAELPEDRLDIYLQLEQIREQFDYHRVNIFVLGPRQRSSSLFRASDRDVVYRAREDTSGAA